MHSHNLFSFGAQNFFEQIARDLILFRIQKIFRYEARTGEIRWNLRNEHYNHFDGVSLFALFLKENA